MDTFLDFTLKTIQGAYPRPPLGPHVSDARASGIAGSQHHQQHTFQKSSRSIFFLGKALECTFSWITYLNDVGDDFLELNR